MLANDKLNQVNPIHSLLSATLNLHLLNSLAQLRQRSSSSSKLALSVTSPQSAAGGSIAQDESS